MSYLEYYSDNKEEELYALREFVGRIARALPEERVDLALSQRNEWFEASKELYHKFAYR
jgi:hypothetical protein